MPYRTTSTFLQTRFAFFGNVVAVIAAARERRRVRFDLHGLNDYLLKDMGISRSDIDRISRGSHPPRN